MHPIETSETYGSLALKHAVVPLALSQSLLVLVGRCFGHAVRIISTELGYEATLQNRDLGGLLAKLGYMPLQRLVARRSLLPLDVHACRHG